jgi:SNF2 family DNA or RNA helicase
MWHETKKVHNHPGILTIPQPYPSSRSKSPVPEDDEDGDADSYSTWWKPFVRNAESLKDVENGYKMVVLLHILEYSKAIDDKVLVFSTCLRTLDYIESVLQLPKWKSLVPSLEDDSIGAYKKNEEYVRIDGSVGSGERGEIVTQFNDEDTGKARVFLISSRAGGIGINLVRSCRMRRC